MSKTAPVAVGIPTYGRGYRVCETIERILECAPSPAQITVHIDGGDSELEREIRKRFSAVQILSSIKRVGPGGGRHRCLLASKSKYFASFDDDSWPVDPDYFDRVVEHFERIPKAAVIAAQVSQRNQPPPLRNDGVERITDYTGCAHAIRCAAYHRISGYVDRVPAYGLEERDVGMQLHVAGWEAWLCGDLRVFHDTLLEHHQCVDITRATVENAAILAFLRYPVSLWPRGFLQFLNVIRHFMFVGPRGGALSGVIGSPSAVWRYRRLRDPLPADRIRNYLAERRCFVGTHESMRALKGVKDG